MTDIRPVRTDADYEAALARIDELMDAEPGTPAGRELDVLVDLVELYERRREPMGHPDPVSAIEFRMEQAGLKRRDLIPFIGSRAKVSEGPVRPAGDHDADGAGAARAPRHSGRRAAAPAEETPVDESAKIEWTRFPLRALAKRGWIPDVPDPAAHAEELVRGLIARAGGARAIPAALYRRADSLRANAKTDPYALRAWCWQALATAAETRPSVGCAPGTVTVDFLRQVARLSCSADGPKRARELLNRNGIPLVIVEHLPKTYLDGAALRLGDGRPVVALTLRYDRLDNFWFCLLHELAHVGRHMNDDGEEVFVDDLTLRRLDGGRQDPREAQADEWAEEALVPRAAWEASGVRDRPTPMAVLNLAQAAGVHPAIVAGRVRYETGNYRLLSQFVGTGEVRRQFR